MNALTVFASVPLVACFALLATDAAIAVIKTIMRGGDG